MQSSRSALFGYEAKAFFSSCHRQTTGIGELIDVEGCVVIVSRKDAKRCAAIRLCIALTLGYKCKTRIVSAPFASDVKKRSSIEAAVTELIDFPTPSSLLRLLHS